MSEDYTDIYVSAGTDSTAPGSIPIPAVKDVENPAETDFTNIIYKRTLANNMSIYVRPVTSVIVHFETADMDVINDFTVRMITTTGDFVIPFPSTRPWASGSAENPTLTLNIARKAGASTHYNYAKVNVRYGSHNIWTPMQNVASGGATFYDNSITLSSALPDMYVTVDVFQVFVHTATLIYPSANWPNSTELRLSGNKIKVNGQDISQTPDTTSPGTVQYNFPETSGASGTSGKAAISINGPQPARILKQKIGDGYNTQTWLLSDDNYKPIYATPSEPFVTPELDYSNQEFNAEVFSFNAVTVNFEYECTEGGKLKLVQYKPLEWQDGWPVNSNSFTDARKFDRQEKGDIQNDTTLTTN